MAERVFRNVPADDVASFRAMLEADGFSVTIEPQADGRYTLRAIGENSPDIQPVDPWPTPGKRAGNG